MFRSPIFWKLTGAVVSLILVSSATIWALALPRVEGHALDQLQGSLENQARLVFRPALGALTEGGPRVAQSHFAALARSTGTRFTVIAADGRVVIDTRENPEVMENHGKRPEILEAGHTGRPARSIRSSRTLGRDMMYVALPIGDTGFVRAALDLEEVHLRRSHLRNYILTAAVIAAVLALLVGLFFTRHLTRRLSAMQRAAEAISAGDYDVRLPVERKDEIGRLAGAVEQMSEQLRDRMKTLMRERNELRAILGSMLEGVVAVDREERIVHMNANAAAILECDPEGSIGQRIWEVTRVQPVGETIAAVLAVEKEKKREARVTEAHRERVLELIASPLRGAGGGLAGVVLVLHDVSELRRLELVRRDFVANVSHELKTPLTAIRGLVETLIDDGEMEPTTREDFLSRVNDQVLRLSTLVTDLLVLSRIESEGEAIERAPVRLRPILRECAVRNTPEVRGRTVQFDQDLPDDPGTVYGDEESLRQMVDNLLDNAFKYTPDGGRVDLRLLAEGDSVVVEVEDTGIGIEASHLDRIFERFYRVDKARSRELGGTGLGLAIVKHIVNLHGGRLSVSSVPGKGSTFRVELPLSED